MTSKPKQLAARAVAKLAQEWVRDENADVNGTLLQAEVRCSYAQLVGLFGKPFAGDGYKVSSEWVLKGPNGEVVTVYDYKSTKLYDSSAPGVTAFRKLPAYDWHIGSTSKDAAERFVAWLLLTLRRQ